MLKKKTPKQEFDDKIIQMMSENMGVFRSIDKATISKSASRERTISAFTNWMFLQALLSKKLFLEFFMTSMEFIVVRVWSFVLLTDRLVVSTHQVPGYTRSVSTNGIDTNLYQVRR